MLIDEAIQHFLYIIALLCYSNPTKTLGAIYKQFFGVKLDIYRWAICQGTKPIKYGAFFDAEKRTNLRPCKCDLQ